MNLKNIVHTSKRQFSSVLKKEGITVRDFYDASKRYKVFFRRNNRSTSPEGKLRMYYLQDEGIKIGTVFTFKDMTYVVVSQDGIESDVYYTSMAVKCDTTFNIYSSTEKKYIQVPFVTMSDSYTLKQSSMFTMVGGYVVVYTGYNDILKDMEVNNGYFNYGGYYKVGNYFYNNNLGYIYLTRELMPEDSYVLQYEGDNVIKMSDATTYQLKFTAIINDEVIENPTMEYASSNESVATVDSNGLMTLHTYGNVTITVTWEGNEYKYNFSIINDNIKGTSNIECSSPTLKEGSYRNFTASFVNFDGSTDSDAIPVWNIDCDFDERVLTIVEDASNKTIKIKCTDSSYLLKTFTLTVVDTEEKYAPYSIVVELRAAF